MRFARRNVAMDAGLRPQRASSPQMQMIGDADLPGAANVVPRGDAASQADLRGERVVFAQFAVVSDHHEIVEFGSLADDRRADHAPVDRRVRADLAVLLDPDRSQLRNLFEASLPETVAESVGPQHGPGVDDHRSSSTVSSYRVTRAYSVQPAPIRQPRPTVTPG